MENWKDVKGFEGLYQVSDKGRVKNIKFGYDRYLSPDKKGDYFRAELYKNNIRYRIFVHQLVLIAFVGPCPDDCNQVDHIDGNPSNNCVENLRWCDGKGNMNNPITKKRHKEAMNREDVKSRISESRKQYWREFQNPKK